MDDRLPFEVKELHSIPLSSIAAPFAVSWSEDNKISVITTSALHVIEVCPNPSFRGPGMCIKRTMIKTCTDMPTTHVGIDPESLFWKLEQPDMYNLLLDFQLAPDLTTTKPVEVRMKQAVWSSPGMFQERRCLLACVTNFGCIKIHAPHQRDWPVILDISAMWVKYCKEHWPSIAGITDPSQLFTILKSRTYQLKTTVIAWSKLIVHPEKFSFLVMGQMNGQIVIWKIPSINVSLLYGSDLTPVLIIDTELQRISAIHWLRWSDGTEILVVGNFEGRVKLVELALNEDQISLIGINDVWPEKDRMQVLCISSLLADPSDEYRIFAITKNSYIIAFLLHKNKIIAQCHHLIGNLHVSGLEMIDNKSFLITTHSGFIVQLNVTHSESELKIEVQEISTSINWKNVACFGIATAVKRGMWIIATSICKLYDHLVIRKPANIIFFYLHGKTVPMQILLQNKSQRLTQYWEFFEIIRIQCMKKILDLNHAYLDNQKCMEEMTTYQLQIELWFTKITLTQATATRNFEKQHQLGKYIHQLEQLLYCRHACILITKLITLSESQSLDKEQLLILYLMRTWVQTWLQSDNLCWDNLKLVAQNKLKLPVPSDMPDEELCILCNKKITPSSSWRYAVCQMNHRVQRCCWTLRQCIDLPYLVCRVCPTIALANNELNAESLCVLCNSPLFLDDKIKLPQGQVKIFMKTSKTSQ